ncbi:MAG: transketolase C-terminal domain-containing protein [Elusimicrobia bacterium]|nr:transketolase C-terminal domain-containing protein [Elusimicrobiota bacterium]
MRNAFAAELTAQAARRPGLILLSGDIGNRLFDRYKARYPGRFINCGVAEGNMIGVAAGLALGGLRPVVYTINSFLSARAYEQIKLDVCYHELPVILVGVGAGLSYAENGATHESCEDVAILRVLPRLKVVAPGDPYEVRAALAAALRQKCPVYIRIGKKGEPLVHARRPALRLGRGIVVAAGRDVCIFSSGALLAAAVAARGILSRRGVSARVVSLHTIKPLDEALLREAWRGFRLVATIEEHSLLGGMGGAVAEWACDHGLDGGKLLRLGTPDRFFREAGGQEFARRRCGLTPPALAGLILRRLGRGAHSKTI